MKDTRNAEYTRNYNKNRILKILKTKPTSRADISRMIGLTRAATSLITAELFEQGLIIELDKVTTDKRGRAPTPLVLNPNGAYAFGVYLNREGCTIGLVNCVGEIIFEKDVNFQKKQKDKLEPIVYIINKMLKQSNIDKDKILGIGISAPGPLDGESGVILNPPKFDIWHNTQIGEVLNKATGFNVFLENNATCLARYHLGKPESKGSENFMLLLVDSGVGSGVVSQNKVLKGVGYYTSEIGHITIDMNGKKCPCGNIGCLETYASIPQILKDKRYYSWKEVIDCEEEREAKRIILDETEYLSVAITTMTNIINIDTVIVAGDLNYKFDHIAPMMEEMVNKRAIRRRSQPIKIVPASNKEGVRILAAADVVFDRSWS